MNVKIYIGDALQRLKALPDNSVDCCITSPPYWGLRDYGVVGQLGLEKTPEEHIAALVKVFREVHRVLKPQGTLWVNYGDTYASSVNGRAAAEVVNDNRTFRDKPFSTVVGKLKPKDLVGLPWLLAFALRDKAGFYLRSDIIWHKPNCMPESAKDRPVKAHEYMFLFSKSPRYYYNYNAVLEPVAANDNGNIQHPNALSFARSVKEPERPGHNDSQHRLSRGKGNNKSFRGGGAYVHNQSFQNAADISNQTIGNQENLSGLRNRRTVWTIPTRGFPEAHFATFPPDLVRPCLLAGCPVGGVVLDPFGGAGTTALEAERQQKNAILIELNPEYADMARRRIVQDGGMFCNIEMVFSKVRHRTFALWQRWLRRKICFWRQDAV